MIPHSRGLKSHTTTGSRKVDDKMDSQVVSFVLLGQTNTDYILLGQTKNVVPYRHYWKQIANFKVVMEISAMPNKMKRRCMVQEVVRILRNTSRNIDRDIKTNQLSEFSERLRISGYKQHARMEIIKRGVEAYEKQVERARVDNVPYTDQKGIRKK